MPNPYSFPFAVGTPYDATPLGCQADLPYYLAAPHDRFLPFVLVRPIGNPNRRLSCAEVQDLDGNTVYTLNLDQRVVSGRLAYEKYHDAESGADYFIYYGARVERMDLVDSYCGPVRLVIDEFVSVAFVPQQRLSDYLLAEWYHPKPLGGVPYGTGLRNRLYIYQGHLQPGPPKEEQESTKDPVTGVERVDFLAQTPTATFETEPLPGWLVEALYQAKACQYFSAAEWSGSLLSDVKTTGFGDCLSRLSLTLEHPGLTVVRSGCRTGLLQLEAEPSGYTVRRWRCGDTSDVDADWQRTDVYQCEQDNNPQWQADLSTYECESV